MTKAKNIDNKNLKTNTISILKDVIPPSDLELEKYVLGCLIYESESFDRISDFITPECFYNDANRDIFTSIYNLRSSGNPIDRISVKNSVSNVESVNNVGGAAYYISCLSANISSTTHLEHHSLYLLELSAKRKLLKTLLDTQILIDSKTDITDVLEMIQSSTDDILKSFNPISNLEDLEVHFSDKIEEPSPIITQGDTLLMSRGNLSFIKGKAKSRKSFLANIFISSFFGNNSFYLQSGVSGGKALLIDTEQSKDHVQKAIKRIYKLNGWRTENQYLKVLALREYNFKERQIILEKAIREYKPDLIILDGAVDIVGDFNNAEESKIVIGLLMKLSTKYNCHICGVLHEGKGNGELRGHYGAEALNKAETIFDVIKDGELSSVSPNATRNIPFNEFAFKIEEGLPVYVGEIQKQTKSEISNTQIKEIFLSILHPNKSMDYTTLVKSYTEFSGKSDRTAKRHIADSLVNRIIMNKDGNYKLTSNENDDMPF